MTQPSKPEADSQPLVGASEAAEIMDVELSTFSHLRRREEAVEGSKFPKPVAILRCGPIWKTTDIKRFANKYVAPRPGPKPAAEVAKPIKKVAAPAKKVPAKAVATNGHTEPEKAPAKKVAAKKTAPLPTKRPLKRAPRTPETVGV
jgi:hypothetical protein